jgi:hypothetical protein
MALTFFARRHLNALRPIDALGEEALADVKAGEVVEVTVKRKRRIAHHNKFFALLNAVFKHQKQYPTMKGFRAAVTVALGYGETVKLPNGRTIIVPDSIAFSKMDQTEFEQFYERALELIETKILPGIDREDVRREVDDIIMGRAA